MKAAERRRMLRRMLRATAAVERASPCVGPPRRQAFVVDGLHVLALKLASDEDGSHTSLRRAIADPRVRVVLGRSSAARLMIGRIDAARQLRFRAFYTDTSPGLTLLAHERVRGAASRVQDAANALEALDGRAAFVIPRLYDRGAVGAFDYLVESVVPGDHPAPGGGKREAATMLLPKLLDTYEAVGIEYEPLSSYLEGEETRARAVALLDAHEWSQEWMPRGRMRELIEEALHPDWDVPVSLCHGDPVPSNIVVTPSGEVALIDWEFGGRMMIGHDLGKVLVATPVTDEQLELVTRRLDALATPRTPPPAMQLAIGLLRHLSLWERRKAKADRSGRHDAYERQIARQLGTVHALLSSPAG